MENEKLDKIKGEMKAKQVAAIKDGVRLTFEKLEELEKQKDAIQNQIKILKHDLFDLKDGRLDRIAERQGMNGEALGISIVIVSKTPGAQVNVSPWYEDYCFTVSGGAVCTVNNSMMKTHASGSFKLKDGTIRYL